MKASFPSSPVARDLVRAFLFWLLAVVIAFFVRPAQGSDAAMQAGPACPPAVTTSR